MAHYLTTIHDLRERQGYARVSDVAKDLDVTKGSASVQVKHLKEKGLVAEDDNRHLHLTEVGDRVARKVIYTRQVLIRLFNELLGVDPGVAESDACKIEHLLSASTINHILALVRLMSSDQKEAKAFRSKFKQFKCSCPGLEDCSVCTDICMLEATKGK